MRLGLRLLLGGLGAIVGFAAAAAVTPGDVSFDIVRESTTIGERVTRFEENGERLIVETDVDIEVRVAFITVYRRTERYREVWNEGVLDSFTATTDDDGEEFAFEARRVDGELVVDAVDGRYTAPPGTLPATLWNVATVEASHLIDLKRGDLIPIEVAKVGTETVNVGGRSRQATRYRVGPDWQRDLWYDENGALVRVRFVARDESVVEFVPERKIEDRERIDRH